MTALGTLIAKVENKIHDPSFTADDITDLLNEGLGVVSGKVKLPELDTTGEVTAVSTEISVPVPDDYQRGLYRCKIKATGRKVAVLNSLGQLARMTGGLEGTGDITHVAVVGRKLFYQGKPAADVVLVLYYYRKPTPMVELTDEPTCIPEHYQGRLLQAYAAGEIFEEIEDGLEGGTPNTTKQQGKFWALVAELERENKEGVSNPAPPCTGVDL